MARTPKVWAGDEWLEALATGEARRLQDRFDKDAADARRRTAKKDSRPDSERFAAEFVLAVAQREELKRLASLRAVSRRPIAPAPVES